MQHSVCPYVYVCVYVRACAQVLIRPVPLLRVQVARADTRPEEVLPWCLAGDRTRHSVLLGGAYGHAGTAADWRGAIQAGEMRDTLQ